jgi:hypothetical protein
VSISVDLFRRGGVSKNAAELFPRCATCRALYENNQALRTALSRVLDDHARQHPVEAQGELFVAARDLMRIT